MKKKLFSILLSMLMLFNSMPVNTVNTVLAEGEDENVITETTETGETTPEEEYVVEEEPPVIETDPGDDPVIETGGSEGENEGGETGEDPGIVETEEYALDFSVQQQNHAIHLQGKAAEDPQLAVSLMSENTDLDAGQIDEIAMTLFASGDDGEEDHTTDGGNTINYININWMVNDEPVDDPTLTVTPADDSEQSIKFRVSYSLAGEYSYEPGTVQFIVPMEIIIGRSGTALGIDLNEIPYPSYEERVANKSFYYQFIDGNLVLTNNVKLSAAAKGFFEVSFVGIIPHTVIDEKVSLPLNASIHVQTQLGNLLYDDSRDIDVVFDTDAQVTSASKRLYEKVRRVGPENIPESQRIEGEESYVLVTWYMWCDTKANTYYTIDIDDIIPETETHNGEEYSGFIINAKDEEGNSLIKSNESYMNDVYHGYVTGRSRYFYVTVAYPASQFINDHEYVFHNTANFILTEDDVETRVTNKEASAQTTYVFHDPKWHDPPGHFNIFKNGNDGKDKGNVTHHIRYEQTFSDLHKNTNEFYGIYGTALNRLQTTDLHEGEDVEIGYTINTVGYFMPWTYDPVEPVTAQSPWDINNWFKRPVKMVSSEEGVSIVRQGETLKVGEDIEFVSVEFPEPNFYTGVPNNINPDGSWYAKTYDDGTFKYTITRERSRYLDISLELLKNGEWSKYATVSWRTGSLVVTFEDGTTSTDSIVALPEGTESFRTIVISEHPEERIAAIDWDVRVVVRLLHTSETLTNLIEEAFSKSTTPEIIVWNKANLIAYETAKGTGDWKEIVDIAVYAQDGKPKDGYDSLRGYTTDTKVYPFKESEITSVDYTNDIFNIHYKVRTEIRSVINDKATFLEAVHDGKLETAKHGIWYDLLPEGMSVDLNSITLREGDALEDAYTLPNYKGSGRTLLVVKATLEPTAERYRQGDIFYYEDVPTLEFDATYSFDYYDKNGDKIHNVVAFEADQNHSLGTIEGYTGEPDDPASRNNVSTERAFVGNEPAWMKDLNKKQNDGPVFVYAGITTSLQKNNEALTSLHKDVDVNHEGVFSSGLYGADPEGNRRDVYTGGDYTYRLMMISDPDTRSKNLVIYDSLENFVPHEGNDPYDIKAERWKGTFAGIDVSSLENMGCAPVVYYYVPTEGQDEVLILEQPAAGDPDNYEPVNTDLTDSTIWTPATDYAGDLSAVKAIAIDCSKKADGSDFVLDPTQYAIVFVSMKAPDGAEAEKLSAIDAHAYNNAYLLCSSLSSEDPEQEWSGSFVRHDYTKVGLLPFSIFVEKIWDDEDDRDGIRPKSVKYTLYANNVAVDEVYLPIETKEGLVWEYTFEGIPYSDENGKIVYYVSEEGMDDYTRFLTKPEENEFVYRNRHIPFRTTVEGKKTWEGDSSEVRPSSIVVNLYADGEFLERQTVYADKDGNWNYIFTDLYKYRDRGIEIEYTVDEVVTGQVSSYVPEVVGTNIINKYHPYGDLLVHKLISNYEEISEKAANKQFTFIFYFNQILDGEEAPVLGDFEYDVLDAEGTVLSSGIISYGGSITIGHDETIHIKELPEGTTYKIEEEELAGFTLTSSTNITGTIRPNAEVEAEVINTYKAQASYNFPAQKTLNGASMKQYQFFFYLYDAGGEVIRTAMNGIPVNVYNEDETVAYSYAPVTFGALRFDETDAGNTYRYSAEEVITDMKGYVFDKTVYDMSLEIVDKGDGTMGIIPTFYKEGKEVEDILFVNEYVAEGDITLTAWKELKGGTLEEGKFTFELLDEHGQIIKIMNEDDEEVEQRKTNDGHGTVSFDTLHYDQTDIGKTYYYLVREVKGDDEAVEYSEDYFGYKIEVSDYGNGTLYVEETLVKPTIAKDDEGNIVYDEEGNLTVTKWEETTDLPVFVNTMKPGDLQVIKWIDKDSAEYDPAQEFHFRVKLIGEDVKDGEYTYTISDAVKPENSSTEPATPGREPMPLLAEPFGQRSLLGGTSVPKKEVFRATDAMLEGQAYAISHITEGNLKELIFFRDEAGKYVNDKTYTVEIDGVDIRGTVYTGFEEAETSTHPWSNTNLVSIKIAEGQAIRPLTISYWFNGASITTADLSRLDTSRVASMYRTFFRCGKLTSLDLSAWDTSNVNNMVETFRECPVLTSLNISTWDTSNVTSFSGMFYYMRAIVTLDLRNFDTSKATDLSSMFSDCVALESVDLSSFVTDNVTNMSSMFFGCSALTSLDLKNFNTSNVTTMGGMFRNCVNLASLDIRNFDTTHNTGNLYIFSNCWKLSRVTFGDKFDFIGNQTVVNNQCLLPDPKGNEYTGKWIKEGDEIGTSAMTATEMRDKNGTYEIAGTWVWQRKPTDYEIVFTAGEGAVGSMENVTAVAAEDYKLPKNQFVKYGWTFDYWSVEDVRTIYEDEGTIPANTYEPGNTVTLKAVFSQGGTVEIENGEFEIILHGGEMATVEGLPAGVAYQIYEETPDGWILIEQKNSSGVIVPLETQAAEFTNRYQPDVTQAQFYGVKMLDNTYAKENSFYFELKDSEGTVLQTKPVLSGGFIKFDPISYTKDQIGTYTYTVTEIDPNDNTIDYDKHKETVTVEVFLNEGGQLVSKVTYDDEEGIFFRNKTRPGNLRVTKEAKGVTDANKDDEFTFEITFTNAQGMPLGDGEEIYWYIEGQDTSSKTAKKIDVNINNAIVNGLIEEKKVFSPGEALPLLGNPFMTPDFLKKDSNVLKEGEQITDGEAYAILTTDGQFIFFRSTETLTAGPNQTVTINGVSYTGRVFTGVENTGNGTSAIPWFNYRESVKKAFVAEGHIIKPANTAHWFNQFTNMTSIDLTGLDTSNVTNMSYMFYMCNKLTALDVTGLDTSNVTNMSYMFCRITKVTALDLSNFNTSKVTNMAYMFAGKAEYMGTRVYQSLKSITFGENFTTSNVTNMSYMFRDCASLTALDVNGWDTSKVENMSCVFHGCAGLLSLDVSSWNTSSAKTMFRMFYDLWKVTSLDLNSWDTSNVTNMEGMFDSCYNLKTLEIGKWNVSKVTTMEDMFGWTSSTASNKIEHLDIGNWDVSSVTNMHGMFAGCWYLKDLDIGNWDVSKVRDMGYAFERCNNLTELDLGGWVTSSAVNMSGMFTTCGNLTYLNIKNFDTSNVTYSMGGMYMFRNCPKLKMVELGPNYSFKGADIPDANYQAILPTPQGAAYTGKWIKIDRTYDALTPEELRDNYDGSNSAMVGLWIWEMNEGMAVVRFLGNGGSPAQTEVSVGGFDDPITMPTVKEVTRPHYALKGWSPDKDMNRSVMYEPGETITYSQLSDEMDQIVDLYAQWVEGEHRLCQVTYYLQSPTNLSQYTYAGYENMYVLVEGTEEELASTVVDYTAPVKAFDGYTSPEAQTVQVYHNRTANVRYNYNIKTYSIIFDGNGADSGSMAEQSAMYGINTNLNQNTYSKAQSIFTGWNTKADGNGTPYSDGQSVRLDPESGSITLYAQWKTNENEPLNPTNGKITVTLKAGETLVIPDLPAGTTYTVREVKLPAGWKLDEIEGATGTIEPGSTAKVWAYNYYDAEGFAQIVVYKNLVGEEIQEGQFTFELLTGGASTKPKVIATATNEATDTNPYLVDDEGNTIRDEEGNPVDNPYYGYAPVYFQTLFFTEEGTYNYSVREVSVVGDRYVYDTKTIPVTVTVTDIGGGKLNAVVTYGEDEPVFTNTLQPGSIDIRKEIEIGENGVVSLNQSFNFKVSFFDEEGKVIEEPFKGTRYGRLIKEPITVTSGDILNMTIMEHITVGGLPVGTTYKVEEVEIPDNWTLISSSNTEGVIRDNTRITVTFTNLYEDIPQETTAQLIAYKTMEHSLLKEEDLDTFAFELQDEDGDTLEVRGVDKVSVKDEETGEWTEKVSTSPITFNEIRYSENDAGKTFTYYIFERLGQDSSVTYDTNTFIAKVTVDYDEEGKLKADTEYFRVEGEEDVPVEKIEFVNKRLTSMTIEKVVDKWEDSSPVTFVFEVTATFNEEVIYHEMESMTFSNTGGNSITIKDLPVDAEVTVKEIYAGGSYEIKEGTEDELTITLVKDSTQNKVSFTNGYNEGRKRGYGAKNSFSKDDEGTWVWVSDLKEGGE